MLRSLKDQPNTGRSRATKLKDCQLKNCNTNTAQKMKFAIKDFFSESDQIRGFLRIWSHLLKKSSMKNFIFVQWNTQQYIHILTRWYVPIQIGHAIDIRERRQFNFVPRAILKNSPSSYSEKMRWGRGCRQSGHA